MSRLLEALKQIDCRTDRTPPTLTPVGAEELALFGLRPTRRSFIDPGAANVRRFEPECPWARASGGRPALIGNAGLNQSASPVSQETDSEAHPAPTDEPTAGDTSSPEGESQSCDEQASAADDCGQFSELEELVDDGGEADVATSGLGEPLPDAVIDRRAASKRPPPAGPLQDLEKPAPNPDDRQAGHEHAEDDRPEFRRPPECQEDEIADERSAPQIVEPAEECVTVKEAEPAYDQLAKKVLSQLPSEGSAVLVFAGVSGGAAQAEMVTRLAAAIAGEVEGTVLIVDADFDDVGMGARLGLESHQGLADVLAGRASWREAVVPSGRQGVSVLGRGQTAHQDGGHLPSGALADLFAELRPRFRLVVLGANATCHDDLSPLARFCDGGYLVVQLGHTPRRAAKKALQAFDKSGLPLLGCVVTDIEACGPVSADAAAVSDGALSD
jgi:Mrp family chromosome partitioning ATPase